MTGGEFGDELSGGDSDRTGDALLALDALADPPRYLLAITEETDGPGCVEKGFIE